MAGVNLSAWAVRHPAFVLFLILAISLAGAGAYTQMGRAEDPSFTIKVMVVTASWPGATASEMQEQVADKLEKKLQELPSLERIETYCRPGFCATQVVLKDTTGPNEVPQIWYTARKKLGDIRNTLPDGVQGPNFDDEYGDVYIAVIAFTGEGFTPAELKRCAESARQRLLRVNGVDKVVLVGDRPEKVFVEFSHSKLATLGVVPQQVFDSLAKENAVSPSGSVDTHSDRVYVRMSNALDAAKRVREVPVEAGGRLFKLADVAEVSRGYEDPPRFLVRHNGKPAVGVAVAMTKSFNVIKLGESLTTEFTAIRAELPAGVDLNEVSFQPRVVEESVSEFLHAFAEALAIVLVVSFLSLGFRTGIVVALSVPLVLAVCFIAMYAAGINLDRITLGALIIALGLLVDDAIIAVEMMVVKMEEGWDRIRAATFAWTSTAFPMLTGTLITAAGFLPVGFAKSAAGEYAGNIFWVVGLALIVSWFVAVIVTPYLGVKLLPNYTKHEQAGHDPYGSRFYRLLRRFIEACAARPLRVVALTALLFVTAMAGFSKVQKQFFPQSARPELLIELRLPEGAAIGATEDAVKKLEAFLIADPDCKYVTSYIGAGPPRFFLSLNPDLPNAGFAKLVVMTPGPEGRERLLAKTKALFDGGEFLPNLRGRVNRFDFGPPVGFPIQFRVQGTDPEVCREIAGRVRDKVRENPNTREAQLDWGEEVRAVKLKVDPDRARAMGLTPADVSLNINTILSGVPVTQYREGTELIDVVARAVPAERLNLGTLPELNILTKSGKSVPLSQVAEVTYASEEPVLWRRNRDTTMTVRADVIDGVQPPDVTAAIWPTLQEIRGSLPPGYRVEIGGAVEESAKANASLFAVFPVMILVMLTLLMAQLQDFRKAFLVFLIAPLGLIGVATFLLIFNAPFGFVALLGAISLAGMDMRNSLILMDQIDQDLAQGATPWDAVIGATVRRARPVLLTAAAAILAMIPLSRSVFWGPMAIAIMGGLSIATFLTLVNLPALYVLCFRVKRPVAVRQAPPVAAKSDEVQLVPA